MLMLMFFGKLVQVKVNRARMAAAPFYCGVDPSVARAAARVSDIPCHEALSFASWFLSTPYQVEFEKKRNYCLSKFHSFYFTRKSNAQQPRCLRCQAPLISSPSSGSTAKARP